MSFFFEDLTIGDVMPVGSFTFTADVIRDYAQKFDPTRFHLDEAAAAAGPFGAITAPGWQVSAAWMPCMYRTFEARAAAQMREGKPVAKLGPSPGLRDIKWLKPVYVDEVIDYSFEVTDKRLSERRPEWGILGLRNRGRNASGETVMQFDCSVFVERRETGTN